MYSSSPVYSQRPGEFLVYGGDSERICWVNMCRKWPDLPMCLCFQLWAAGWIHGGGESALQREFWVICGSGEKDVLKVMHLPHVSKSPPVGMAANDPWPVFTPFCSLLLTVLGLVCGTNSIWQNNGISLAD